MSCLLRQKALAAMRPRSRLAFPGGGAELTECPADRAADRNPAPGERSGVERPAVLFDDLAVETAEPRYVIGGQHRVGAGKAQPEPGRPAQFAGVRERGGAQVRARRDASVDVEAAGGELVQLDPVEVQH